MPPLRWNRVRPFLAATAILAAAAACAGDVDLSGLLSCQEARTIPVASVRITSVRPTIRVGQDFSIQSEVKAVRDGDALCAPLASMTSSDTAIAAFNFGTRELRGLKVGTTLVRAEAGGRFDTTTVTVVNP